MNTLTRANKKTESDDAGFKYEDNTIQKYKQPMWWQTDMLPEQLRHDSGTGGSHTFNTHEFIDALVNIRKPLVDVYEALAYTDPGIMGHPSALRNGEYMTIPDFDN
jgi:hypothetical protein